jgi:lipoprotein NlpD
MKLLVVLMCLALLSACHRHLPAPTKDQTSGIVKRQLNSDGSYYVRSGDTLYAIAFSYGLDHMEVAKWNGISSPYTIYPGQKLWLSSPSKRGRGSSVQISTIKSPSHSTKTVSSKSAGSTPPAAAQTTSKAATRSTNKPVSSASNKGGSASNPKSWKWPASGRVLRGFVAGNPARNGLDISGREGQTIIATAKGQVVYSGDGLIGYGELIIIKHSEKMLSAYAHNKVRLVKEGELVNAGQKIAEMGRSPENEQLLHFEIRVNGKPVNPMGYLPAR